MNVDDFIGLLDDNAAATASTQAAVASATAAAAGGGRASVGITSRDRDGEPATGCPAHTAQPGAGQPLPDLKSKVQRVIWSCYG